MRGTASANGVARKSSSLMQRLALVGAAEGRGPERGRTSYEPSVGAYFGIGLLAGGLVGVVVLTGGLALRSAQLGGPEVPEVPAALAALALWIDEPARSPQPPAFPAAAAPKPAPDVFDMVVDRSAARAGAPFGLRLVGSEDAGMEVLLRGLPATAVPSRGERRDASTWVLKAADLEALHLALNDGTPDAFELRIEVLAPAGVAAASSIARVRLAELPGAEPSMPARIEARQVERVLPDTTVAGVETVADVEAPFRVRSVASGRNDGAREPEKMARVQRSPVATTSFEIDRQPPPQIAPQAEARHWPEGASGLGAMSRESDRQVWWKLPAPAWTPFKDMAGR